VGWTSDGAYQSDVALNFVWDNPGDNAGWFGFAYDPNGLNNVPTTSASYPQQTVSPAGRYFAWSNSCTITDTDGNDGSVRVDGQCGLWEHGSSGCPLWVRNGDDRHIRGVLHGGTEGADAYNLYAELSRPNFDFWMNNVNHFG
jgi:hypothetical protein